jgi:hypothetical protein
MAAITREKKIALIQIVIILLLRDLGKAGLAMDKGEDVIIRTNKEGKKYAINTETGKIAGGLGPGLKGRKVGKINSGQKESGSAKEPQDIGKLLGPEYKDVKGQAAIDKLLEEKQGHVKGAFHRDDIGGVDLLWGDDAAGLQHIIKQRETQNIEIKAFFSNLAEVVEKGKMIGKNDKGRFEILHNGKIAVVSPELRSNKLVFLLTAYKTSKK